MGWADPVCIHVPRRSHGHWCASNTGRIKVTAYSTGGGLGMGARPAFILHEGYLMLRQFCRPGFAAAAIGCLLPLCTGHAAADNPAALLTTDANARPRVGLVLAGGGAKGGAHVGVLKVMEEMNVPVDCIAGTSMGALI